MCVCDGALKEVTTLKMTEPSAFFYTFPWLHWQRYKPNAIALNNEGQCITWQKLSEDINCACHSIRFSKNKALYQNNTFAMKGDTCYKTLVIMLAAWQLGKSTLLINPDFSEKYCQKLIENIGVNYFSDQDIDKTATRNVFSSKMPSFYAKYDPFLPLTITLTSGSSGFPKAIVHNAKQHIASAVGLFSAMAFEETDVWLLSLPLYHISGLAIIWRWLVKGASLKIAKTKGEYLLSALKDVTHASLVPSQLYMLLKHPLPNRFNSVLLGGAQIPLSLSQQAEEKGIKAWCGYGMTEMASTITVKRANCVFSVGQVLPYRKIKITSNGEILVRGETRALGQYSAGKIKPFKTVWFETKDKGYWLFESKELVITGRLDNVFQSGGENVQPEIIEKILSEYKGVKQIFIFPMPDKRWGNVPIAVLDGEIDETKFLAWGKKKLVNYLQPKAVFLMPNKFKLNGIKVSRVKLAQWVKQHWTFS